MSIMVMDLQWQTLPQVFKQLSGEIRCKANCFCQTLVPEVFLDPRESSEAVKMSREAARREKPLVTLDLNEDTSPTLNPKHSGQAEGEFFCELPLFCHQSGISSWIHCKLHLRDQVTIRPRRRSL